MKAELDDLQKNTNVKEMQQLILGAHASNLGFLKQEENWSIWVQTSWTSWISLTYFIFLTCKTQCSSVIMKHCRQRRVWGFIIIKRYFLAAKVTIRTQLYLSIDTKVHYVSTADMYLQKFLIIAYAAGTSSVHSVVIVFRPLTTKEKKVATPITH